MVPALHPSKIPAAASRSSRAAGAASSRAMGASRSAQSLAAGRKRLLGTELLSQASSGPTAVALSAGGWLALRPPEIVEPEPVTPRGQTIYAKESLMNRQVRSTWSSVPAKVVLAALLVVLPVARGSAGDIYVDQNATGANNGTSWANAYKDLQPALIAAVSGDTLRVAQGVYKPTAGYSRAPTFQLKNRVTLYGGYPTGGGTRNPAANVTTLSGDIGTVGDNSDNSYHVVTGRETDNTAVLDGFTITGGNASGGDPDDRGGGMYSKAGSPTVQNVIFTGNSATNDGGGMYYDAGGTLTNVTFAGNAATNGGGMYRRLRGARQRRDADECHLQRQLGQLLRRRDVQQGQLLEPDKRHLQRQLGW